jgi:hypothetical protein
VDTREVSDDQMTGIGGVRRKLEDVLTEVAEGKSQLIYMG